MAARNRAIRLPEDHRKHIQATQLLKRLNAFALADPDNPNNGPSLHCPTCNTLHNHNIRMTRTQVHVALALLRKVLPDLASVEVTGNPEKPLMVQVVRFSDGEQLEPPRPVLDMGRLIEMDATETRAIEDEATGRKNGQG